MSHARLGIGEENSGKLVALIRQVGKKLAEEKSINLLLTDGPPGIGCPVIASLGGATAVLIVTEPTVSGRRDMERVAELAAFFKVPGMVCVNKFDLNPDQGRAIEDFARERQIRVMGRIPFDPVFTVDKGKGVVFRQTPEDCTFRQREAVLAEIEAAHPKIVDIYVMLSMSENAFDLAIAIRQRMPETLLVRGGPLPTLRPQQFSHAFYLVNPKTGHISPLVKYDPFPMAVYRDPEILFEPVIIGYRNDRCL